MTAQISPKKKKYEQITAGFNTSYRPYFELIKKRNPHLTKDSEAAQKAVEFYAQYLDEDPRTAPVPIQPKLDHAIASRIKNLNEEIVDEFLSQVMPLIKSQAKQIEDLTLQISEFKEQTYKIGDSSRQIQRSARTPQKSEYRISPKVLNQEPRQTAGGGSRSHEMDPAGFTPGFHPEPTLNRQEIGLLARALAGLPLEGAGWAL